MGKLPSFQFYPGDWLRDAVSGCTLAAQGLWLRMMIVMHDSPKYGYLTQNGDPMPEDQVARRCGCTLEEFRHLFAELQAAGVPRFDHGIVHSKRMVQDQKRRDKQTVRKQIYREKYDVPQSVPPLSPQCPTRSSSSSSSSSSKKQKHMAIGMAFSDFWKAYPRKVKKPDAEKAWKQIKPTEDDLKKILHDIEHRWKDKDIQFTPYPGPYLRNRRWEDEEVEPDPFAFFAKETRRDERTDVSGRDEATDGFLSEEDADV